MASPQAETARFWEQLLQFVEEGRVVPVVGQDLLVVAAGGREVLLYQLLAERLAEKLAVPAGDLAPDLPLNTVVCRYLADGGELEDVYPALKSVMPGPEELAVPEPLAQLAGIRPFRLFVSTTFDSLLQRAVDAARFGGQPRTRVLAYSPSAVEDLDADLQQLDPPVVYHLFGRLSAVPDYVVTEEDTLELVHSLQSETRRPQRLFDELTRNQVLLIGGNFPDWLARFFLRIAKRERLWTARGKTDVVADARVRDDPGLALFLQHFSARTKVFQGGGARDFVRELAARWAERHPPAAPEAPLPAAEALPGSRDMAPGAVFLSYASEDRPAVQAIREELERAGVDVWFDRGELGAGDAYERKIRGNIERCSLFLPILSRQTVTPARRFFRLEWDHAEKVAVQVPPTLRFIVPVAIDDLPPDAAAIPESFRKLHWVRLPEGRPTPDFVAAIRQLYRDYQRAIAGGA